jgi:hypothetical protein
MSDILPKGLQFLEFGWWIMHALAVYLVYAWAYRRGRRDEKNARLHGGRDEARTQPKQS